MSWDDPNHDVMGDIRAAFARAPEDHDRLLREAVPIEQARAAGPFMLCQDHRRNCPGSDDRYCSGGYEVDGDDWLRCHGED